MNSLLKIIEQHEWCKWIIGVDLFLVAFTVIVTYMNWLPWIRFFHLGHELNAATWWSGISLLSLSLLAYELFCTKKDDTKTAWLILSLLLLALSLDEIGSIHERVGGWSVLWKFAVVGTLLLAYSMITLFRSKESKRSATFLMIGFIMFATVAIQERLEHYLDWPFLLKGIRVGVEEGTELLGILLCFFGIVSQRNCQDDPLSITKVIPNPFRMKYLSTIIFIGLFINSIISFFTSFLTDSPPRGNPAIWYPASLFFILFAASFFKFLKRKQEKSTDWLILAICFIIFSCATVMNPRSKLFSNFYSFSLCQLPLIALLYVKIYKKVTMKNFLTVSLLAILLLLGYLSIKFGFALQGTFVEFIVFSIYAFSIVKLVLFDALLFDQKMLVSGTIEN